MDQNSEITGYNIQYGPVDSVHKTTDTVTGSASAGEMHTVIGLIPSTNYSIEVAAVNSDGDVGPFTPSIISTTTSIRTCKSVLIHCINIIALCTVIVCLIRHVCSKKSGCLPNYRLLFPLQLQELVV